MKTRTRTKKITYPPAPMSDAAAGFWGTLAVFGTLTILSLAFIGLFDVLTWVGTR